MGRWQKPADSAIYSYFSKDFKTYYEPFLGGGAIFFHLQPKVAVLTDINTELINVYHGVRDKVENLISLLENHQLLHSKDYYYQMRASSGGVTLTLSEGTLVKKGARFVYLNKTCFNGLYQENLKGEFNVPIGKYKNPKICSSHLLRSVSVSLQSAQIKVRPFKAVLEYAKTADDFVYFDPPYFSLSDTSNFTAYSRYSFT